MRRRFGLLSPPCFCGSMRPGTARRFFSDARDLKHGAAIGGFFGVEFLMLYYGIDLTNASRAIIFLYTQPLWTALGAHFFLSAERLSVTKSMGLLLSFAGLVTVFGSKPGNLGPLYWVGDLMEVGAAALWAATSIYIKRFMLDKPITHYQTLFAQLFFSIPVLAAGWILFEWGRPIKPDSARNRLSGLSECRNRVCELSCVVLDDPQVSSEPFGGLYLSYAVVRGGAELPAAQGTVNRFPSGRACFGSRRPLPCEST